MKANAIWENQAFPELEGCLNCGVCCGMVPISPTQIQSIKDYLLVNPKAKEFALTRLFNTERCVFRDNESRKCLIYPARPYVCRAFGVTDAPTAHCRFAKSTKIAKYNPPEECHISKLRLINEVFGNPTYTEKYKSLNKWILTMRTTEGFLVTSLKPEIDSIILAHGDTSVPEIIEHLVEYRETLTEEDALTLVKYAKEKL